MLGGFSCVTNYPNFSGLKQQPFKKRSQFCKATVSAELRWVVLLDMAGLTDD